MEPLEQLLNEVKHHTQNGNRKALSLLLKEIIPERINYFHKSQFFNRLDEFTDILYKILWLELDEGDDESIELAELAYLGISESIRLTPELNYELVRKRIILLHYFSDYFTDSIIDIFLKKFRKNNLLEARGLALDSLAHMQLADLYFLEQHFGDQVDQDEGLNETCNQINIAALPNQQELENAALMHRILYAYLKVKYQTN